MEEKGKCIFVGNKGLMADCFVRLDALNNNSISVLFDPTSIYIKEKLALVKEMVAFFEVVGVKIYIEDNDASLFVIAARVEYGLRQLFSVDKSFLMDIQGDNMGETQKNRPRVSRLYIPGNMPRYMRNAAQFKASGIILDLEASVALGKKEEARYMVRNALREMSFGGAERCVRINRGELGFLDLELIIPQSPNLIVIPKVESAVQVQEIEQKIKEIQTRLGLDAPIWLMPIIESALGIVNVFAIASASKSIASLVIGLEDYTADIGVGRTVDGKESLFARSQLVNACKAVGIQAIDSVFGDIGDEAGFLKIVKEARAIGFDGVGCIHPAQVAIVHKGFTPSEEEIEQANRIISTYQMALDKGFGVSSLGPKMIAKPIVKRAEKVLDLAKILNEIKE